MHLIAVCTDITVHVITEPDTEFAVVWEDARQVATDEAEDNGRRIVGGSAERIYTQGATCVDGEHIDLTEQHLVIHELTWKTEVT